LAESIAEPTTPVAVNAIASTRRTRPRPPRLTTAPSQFVSVWITFNFEPPYGYEPDDHRPTTTFQRYLIEPVAFREAQGDRSLDKPRFNLRAVRELQRVNARSVSAACDLRHRAVLRASAAAVAVRHPLAGTLGVAAAVTGVVDGRLLGPLGAG
jgi:hypothetical protein